MSRLLLPLLCALMMTACASGVRPTGASLKLPRASPQDMLPCQATVTPPASGQAGDLLANHLQAMRQLQECAARQAGLAQHIQAVTRALEQPNE